VALRGEAIRGGAGRVLVDRADRPDDLLVVGAGGAGRLGRYLRPSVTTYCARNARCPLLVVPEPELLRELAALRRRRVWRLPARVGPGAERELPRQRRESWMPGEQQPSGAPEHS
jgi:hypothetical protein